MWGALFPAFIAGVAYVYDVSWALSICLNNHHGSLGIRGMAEDGQEGDDERWIKG